MSANDPISLSLLNKAQLGDKNSMEELLNNIRDNLHNFIYSRSVNHSECEDLIQETYLIVIGNIRKFKCKSSFVTWVLGIALNVIRNHYNRSPQYKYKFFNDDSLIENLPFEKTLEYEFEFSQGLGILNDKFQGLPDHIKKVVKLFAIDGLSYNEISKNLHVSIPCVKSRLHRARKILRE